MTPGTWILIALGAALVAMAVSGLGRGAPGVRLFLADLRAWWRREPDPTGIGAFAEARRELVETEDAAEGGVEDLFEIGEHPETAYVEPSAEPLVRVTQRAVESMSRVQR
jgi:hypothetical protein